VTWVDAAGRREPWNSIWVSGTRLVVDRMLEPVHLRRHLKALDALIREGPMRMPRHAALDRCLYLRLDTVSGLVAGGAVAHTVGGEACHIYDLFNALTVARAISTSAVSICDGAVYALDAYKALTVKGREGLDWSGAQDKGHVRELAALGETLTSGGAWPIPLWQQIQATEIAFAVENAVSGAGKP
jgi:hypothetical protein